MPTTIPTATKFVVEVHDPYSEHPHLTDERFDCGTVEQLIRRIEDATGLGTFKAAVAAGEVLSKGRFDHQLDGGVEVTAHRVGEPTGSAV